MIMTDSNTIRAALEMLGTAACVIATLLIFIMTRLQKKSDRVLMLIMLVEAVLLAADAAWYFNDGSLTAAGFVINRLSNLAQFLGNPILILLAANYITAVISELGTDSRKAEGRSVFTILIGILAVISILLTFINIRYPLMYDFTTDNIYYRMTGWYIYSILLILDVVILIIYTLKNFRAFDKFTLLSLLVFCLAPILGTVMQFMTLGVSLVNTGICVGLLMLFFGHMRIWALSARAENSKRRDSLLIINLSLVMLTCVLVATFSSGLALWMTSDSELEENSKVKAHMVSESIDNLLMEPVTVAKTMSESDNIKNILSRENLSNPDDEGMLTKYLTSICDGLGFDKAFACCDATREFCSRDGFEGRLKDGEAKDFSWYTDLIDSGRDYELTVNTDETGSDDLYIYVNMVVRDSSGSCLGACGVGEKLTNLTDVIGEWESEYNIGIQLVDRNGVVQAASDIDEIGTMYQHTMYFYETDSDEFYYRKSNNSATMIKYMEDAAWYLVITDDTPSSSNFMRTFTPNLLIVTIGIAVMLGVFWIFNSRDTLITAELRRKEEEARRDGLTGIDNRYSLELEKHSDHDPDWYKNLRVVMMDINGLKYVNDNIGHSAGDELIKAAAMCAEEAFSDCGTVYRLGGDELMAYIHDSSLSSEDLVARIKKTVAEADPIGESGIILSLSAGAAGTDEYPDYGLSELEKEADERMYQDKERYYQETGKDRRRS